MPIEFDAAVPFAQQLLERSLAFLDRQRPHVLITGIDRLPDHSKSRGDPWHLTENAPARSRPTT